jgi:hypothetical protein
VRLQPELPRCMLTSCSTDEATNALRSLTASSIPATVRGSSRKRRHPKSFFDVMESETRPTNNASRHSLSLLDNAQNDSEVVDSDHKPAVPKTKMQKKSPRTKEKPSKESLLSAVEMVFLYPYAPESHESWYRLHTLTYAFQYSMKDKIATDYLSTEGRREKFDVMIRNPDTYIEHGCCVGTKVRAHSHRPVTQSMADGEPDRACDYCIRAKRLCARIVEINGIARLGVYPLPSAFREGQAWTEMGYWVQGG